MNSYVSEQLFLMSGNPLTHRRSKPWSPRPCFKNTQCCPCCQGYDLPDTSITDDLGKEMEYFSAFNWGLRRPCYQALLKIGLCETFGDSTSLDTVKMNTLPQTDNHVMTGPLDLDWTWGGSSPFNSDWLFEIQSSILGFSTLLKCSSRGESHRQTGVV